VGRRIARSAGVDDQGLAGWLSNGHIGVAGMMPLRRNLRSGQERRLAKRAPGTYYSLHPDKECP